MEQNKQKYENIIITKQKNCGVDISRNKGIDIEKIENVNDTMQTMDIFLLPSRFEGLGLVLIEAQCIGLKCRASNNISLESKITELVEDDFNLWIEKN